MMHLQVLCVGKLKEGFYIQAAAEYEKRLASHCKLHLLQRNEEKLPLKPSAAQIQQALTKEGQGILEKIQKNSKVVALCVEGASWSSERLSEKLLEWMGTGDSHVTFVIGGSYGLSPQVKERADIKLSLSAMTFPHHLARIMLLEQIYRGFQMNQGSPYHK